MFALSLPFNLSCRMERLFNSSITRKCPPEHKRSRAKAGEAGYYPHLSACKICWRAEEVRSPPWKTGICCKCFEHPSRDFKGRRVYCDFYICNSDANQNMGGDPRVAQRILSPTRSHRLHMHLFPGRAPHVCSRRLHLHNFQSGCRWPHLKRHTSGRVEALACRHVCLFRLSFLWV